MVTAAYRRKSTLIDKKFREYLGSIIFAAMAMSANVIVDGIIVGNLLGSRALAAVNIAGPIPMLVGVVLVALGIGGATSIAMQKGRRNPAMANTIFTVCMAVTVFLMAAVCIAGQVFFDDIMGLFALRDAALYSDVSQFLRPLLLGIPFMIITAVLQFLVSADGFPRLVMRAAMLNCGVNLCLDVVYIQCFSWGIAGAAWATVTGFASGFACLAWFYWRRNSRYPRTLELCRIVPADFKCLRGVLRLGIITALMQFFLFLQQFCMNYLVLQQLGAIGMIALSVCLNCRMLVFIVINGASNTMGPMLGVLLGERDLQGIRFLLRKTFRFIFTAGLGILLLLECAPELVLLLYGITAEQERTLGIYALRVFVLAIPLMGFTCVLAQYYQIIREMRLAMLLGCVEGFLGVVPTAYLLSGVFGTDGLWWGFLCAELLGLAVIFIGSRAAARRSQGERQGVFLLQQPGEDQPIYEVTARSSTLDAVQVSQDIICRMRQAGIEERIANLLGMTAEEMLIEMKQPKQRECDVDIFVRRTGGRLVMSFRDNGAACNYLQLEKAPEEGAVSASLDLLRKLAEELRYDYVLGFNCMTVVI